MENRITTHRRTVEELSEASGCRSETCSSRSYREDKTQMTKRELICCPFYNVTISHEVSETDEAWIKLARTVMEYNSRAVKQ